MMSIVAHDRQQGLLPPSNLSDLPEQLLGRRAWLAQIWKPEGKELLRYNVVCQQTLLHQVWGLQ